MKKDFSFAYMGYRRSLWYMLIFQKLNHCVRYVGTKSACNKKLCGPSGCPFPESNDFNPFHEAAFGRTAKHTLELVKEENLPSRLDPDIILMHLGTNDILAGTKAHEIIEILKDIIE
eukprot:gene18340-5847_t